MSTAPPVRPSLALVLVGALLAGGCGDQAASPGGSPPPTTPAKTSPKGPKGGAPTGPGTGAGKNEASAQLAYRNGLQMLLKGQPEKAREELQRAVKLDARMSEAFFELGKLEVHLSAQNVGSQARDLDILELGLASLEKARDLEPSNDHYWFWVGRASALLHDEAKAKSCLLKAVELNPKHAPAWKALGLRQKEAGELETAAASFEQAIANDPADAGAYFQLGQTQESRKLLSEARTSYDRSIQLDPTSPEVFGRLTQVCAMLGDTAGEERARAAREGWKEYDLKLERRRRAINQNPSDAAALRRLGEMYFEVGKWEEALEWFLRSIHVDSKDYLTHLYCGVVRRHLHDYTTAADHLKESEFLAPDYLDPKLELLRLYAETEDEASLGELLAGVETAAAEDGESLYALAEVCREIARPTDATRLFAKAKALGVTSAPLESAQPDDGG